MNKEYIIAHADKTVLKISGLSIKGLNTVELENNLENRLGVIVRVIGVAGESIDLDVYGIDAKDILKDEKGIISAISLTEGITAEEVAKITYAKRIIEVDESDLDKLPKTDCPRERWLEYL